jgi:hypothetical protein
MSGKNFFLYSLLLSFLINFFLYFIFENKSAIGQGAYCQPLPYLTFSGPWPGQGYLVMTSSTPNVLVRYAGTGAGIVSGSGSPGQIAFWSGASILSGDNNLFWDNTNKRLGIGTTTPQTALHVVGDITATNFIGNYAGTISSANVSSGVFGSLTGGGNFSFPAFLGISTSSQINLPQPLSVYGNAYIEGNLGIGTTTPTAKLYVRTTDTTTVPFQVEALVQPLVGWSYRRPITISNSGGALTDYQVLVTLDTQSLISAGKMRSDCGDIRFTDSNGSTLLNYWIESGCNTASTKIWVKVPSIPASSSKTIYVYYGNPSATSLSNGNSTFEFFDDFNGTGLDTNKWVAYANSYSVSNSVLRVNIGGIERTSPFPFNFQDGYIAETKVIHYALAADYGGVLPEVASSPFTASGNANADATILYMREGGSATVYYWIGNGASASYNVIYASTGWTSSDNVWYVTGVSVRNGEVKLWRDGTPIVTVAGITWYKNLKYVKLGSFTRNPAHNIQDTGYDWIRVRKYTSPEPTTSVGTEESSLRQQTVFSIEPGSGAVKAQMVSWTGMGMAVWDRAGTYSWVVPAGVYRVRAIVTGGGGGGGSSGSGDVSGGGGGAGATAFAVFSVTPGEYLTIIVGAGGLGGVPHNYGSNGQSSKILRGSTVIVEASGGAGGGYSINPNYGTGEGGSGGVMSFFGPDVIGFSIPGGSGDGGGQYWNGKRAGGGGGASFWGGGVGNALNGQSGAPGSGGGGGMAGYYTGSEVGRTGRDGIVVIFY